MDRLSAFLATVPELAWAALVLTVAVPVIAAVFPHVRFRFHHWRLGRRLLVQPVIFAEELREYQQAAGDEPEPIEWLPLIGGGILSGGVTACIILFQQNGFDRWVAIAMLLFSLGSVAFTLWHKVNDPPEQTLAYEEPGYRPSYEVPPEALQGFALAAMTLFMLAVIIMLFRA